MVVRVSHACFNFLNKVIHRVLIGEWFTDKTPNERVNSACHGPGKRSSTFLQLWIYGVSFQAEQGVPSKAQVPL